MSNLAALLHTLATKPPPVRPPILNHAPNPVIADGITNHNVYWLLDYWYRMGADPGYWVPGQPGHRNPSQEPNRGSSDDPRLRR